MFGLGYDMGAVKVHNNQNHDEFSQLMSMAWNWDTLHKKMIQVFSNVLGNKIYNKMG